MIEQELKQLGFHKNEIKVYLALFELGKGKAGEIIEAANIHRNLVYTALDVLVGRGLVTKTNVNGIAMFTLSSPGNLLEEIDHKRQLTQKIVEELKSRQEKMLREITIFEGFDGIKRATRQNFQAEKGETVYVLGASTHEILSDLSMRWRAYDKKRIEKGIGFKALYGRGTDQHILDGKNVLPMTEAKYMPSDIDAPMWFNICGDVSSIVAIDKEPIAINIKSKQIANGLKQYFNHLWNQKTITFQGNEGFEKAFGDILQTLQSGDELLVMGMFDFDPEFAQMIAQFHEKRSKKGIKAKILLNENACKLGDILKYLPHTNIKYMQKGIVTPAVFLLYKNKTVISLPNQRTFIQIENEEATESFRVYFYNLWNQEERILQGPEALKELWLEGIDTKEIRWIGARGYFVDNYPKFFEEICHKAEQTSGLKCKLIIDPGFRGHILTRLSWIETRYNLSSIKNPNAVWLFGNKVLIISWAKKEPVIFLTTNSTVVQSYNDYFEELWNMKK
ncbi:MAG: helix-turn-helix domain-containing protein [Candidatus Magasanikbacteria bacterium]